MEGRVVLARKPPRLRVSLSDLHTRPECIGRTRPVRFASGKSRDGSNQMNLQPLGDRVVVEVVEAEEATGSGIVLPDTAREKQQRGRVLAVGPGGRSEKNGERVPIDLVEGDEVVFSKYGG